MKIQTANPNVIFVEIETLKPKAHCFRVFTTEGRQIPGGVNFSDKVPTRKELRELASEQGVRRAGVLAANIGKCLRDKEQGTRTFAHAEGVRALAFVC